MRAGPLRGFAGGSHAREGVRPHRLGATSRPRISTHVEREGKEVLFAVTDGHCGFTVRMSTGGAAALGLQLHDAGCDEDAPIYAVDVVGELESCNQEHSR